MCFSCYDKLAGISIHAKASKQADDLEENCILHHLRASMPMATETDIQ